MGSRVFGKRKIPKSLEYNSNVTIKKINVHIKDLGYRVRFAGYDREYLFPCYSFYPIHSTSVKLINPIIMVYALGDYTIEEWRKQLEIKLLETAGV